MTRVGIATAVEVSDLDDEDPLLLAALSERGVTAEPVVWDADVDWAAHEVIVVRSTWDYAERLPEFLTWADRVASVSRLLNSAEVIRWNTDKRYLADTADRGHAAR